MIRWYALAALVLAGDQLTKYLAMDLLTFGRSVEVLPFLAWTLACNEGAAFSMFQGYGWVFAIVAVVISVYLIVEIWRADPDAQVEGAAYGFILAGALGNLSDRLTHQCVVDFVHVRYEWFNFPVFNLADSAIFIGAVGWIYLLILEARGVQRAKIAENDSE